MTGLTSFLSTLNSLSPLAVIALLGVVIFYMVKYQAKAAQITTLTDNHLSDLPAILDGLNSIRETLQRMEVDNVRAFSAILSKLAEDQNDRRRDH
jgi:hypothetical protein